LLMQYDVVGFQGIVPRDVEICEAVVAG
jgi:hypothetical protein